MGCQALGWGLGQAGMDLTAPVTRVETLHHVAHRRGV